jgi:putative transferase (TIGR04331 family)
MPTIARYLITTANERTWKFDRPVIFLGEWCRIYDRKHIWQGMDAIISAPYGLGQIQKDADHAEALALEEKLFPILCDALNQHHGTQHGARFWRIVLGHWVRRYVNVILNRVRTLEHCLHAHQLSGTTAYSDKDYLLTTMDSYAAVWAFNDDRWNNALYVRILNLLGVINIPMEVIADDESDGFRLPATATRVPLKRKILTWGYKQAGKLARLLSLENDAFIINTYLPRKEELKLQLALAQVPQLPTSLKPDLTKLPDRVLRRNLSDQIAGKTNNTVFGIMCSLVFELLPVCYLEGYAEQNKKVRQLPWPKKPKFIFTSNNFDTDEMFKLWAALKVECGTKYIIGQHGNNYGTYRYMYPSIEESTADKFLTWGWIDGLRQHTPAFIFKSAGREVKAYSEKGGLLLIELHAHQRINTWDGAFEFGNYFADQQAFIDKLQKPIRNHLTIRLPGAHIHFKWDEEARWREFDTTIKLDTGSSEIGKLISQSRLVVHSYDSTGILETLSQNIPTLAFWQNGFDHLRDSAKPYYKLLLDAGIVHFTSESVAYKTNEVWEDVDGWWRQSKIQDARKQFCDRYARLSRDPMRDLKKILMNNIYDEQTCD